MDNILLNHSNKQPLWIDTPSQFEELLNTLKQEPILAVDTESDSLYSYFEKVCLIQFSTPTTDYLVDPLNVDISGLDEIFKDQAIQKIFHAAEYDILSLKRDYDFRFVNLFDTMLAAKMLGWSRYGLATILQDQFKVNLDKRFQRYNWGQRPLSKDALQYAHLDTHYLIRLREIQYSQLLQKSLLTEAIELFNRQTYLPPLEKTFSADDFWRIKGSRQLEPRQQSILRELFILRDGIARKLDRPPFKIVNDATLVNIATGQPSTITALRHIKGVGHKLLKYNGQDILKAIKNGKNTPPPTPRQNHHRPDEITQQRYETLRHWRNNLASKRGITPDVIITNGALMLIARRNPQNLTALAELKGIGEQQCKKYGKDLLKVLKQVA